MSDVISDARIAEIRTYVSLLPQDWVIRRALTDLFAALDAAHTNINIKADWIEKTINQLAEFETRALAAEAERDANIAVEMKGLMETIDRTCDAIGDRWLLDPPDGGDVKLWEGAERMAAHIAKLEADRDKSKADAKFWMDSHQILKEQLERILAAIAQEPSNNG
jgi:hypothetical protein